jgi:HK97 family phage portal protein
VLVSKGALVVKTPTFPFTPATSSDWWYESERKRPAAYAELYRCQLWVGVVVSKRARGVARLPLKVYIRDDMNRPEAPADNPYARLMREPNPAMSTFRFWEWTSSTYDVFGEAAWLKLRDNGGRPYALAPLHPTALTFREGLWYFDNGTLKLDRIKPADLVWFHNYNPADMVRGLSALEQLRETLANEAASRNATSSFWEKGARPGFALTHPNTLSEPAQRRLRAQWDDQHAGARNAGSTLILEEGMEPKLLQLTQEDAQYIETRKLNREEVCAAYDIPPPVVHILDHATYSNITEQMRSMYRDTMAPHLKGFEADIDTQLRRPDFGDDVYAEFLMDEVLRGDFEQRAEAYAKADYMTIAEKRRAENLPFIPGTDVILVNTASLPLDRLNEPGPVDAGAPGNADTPAIEPADPVKVESVRLDQRSVRSVMGRLSWQKELGEVDPRSLSDGLSTEDRAAVWSALALATDVPDLKARLKEIAQ